MTLPVRISDEADAEMAEAARWYEKHRAGLGSAFVATLDEVVARIAEAPRLGSPAPLVNDQSIRRRAVARFPYHVVYVELSDRIQVLAIAHDRRRPAYWVGRLPV